jgi:hypothetical protein
MSATIFPAISESIQWYVSFIVNRMIAGRFAFVLLMLSLVMRFHLLVRDIQDFFALESLRPDRKQVINCNGILGLVVIELVALIHQPENGVWDILFPVKLINNRSDTFVLWIIIKWLCSQKAVAALSNPPRTVRFVERSNNCSFCYSCLTPIQR